MTATATTFFDHWIEVAPGQWKLIRDCSDAEFEAAQRLAKVRSNPLRQFHIREASTRPV